MPGAYGNIQLKCWNNKKPKNFIYIYIYMYILILEKEKKKSKKVDFFSCHKGWKKNIPLLCRLGLNPDVPALNQAACPTFSTRNSINELKQR